MKRLALSLVVAQLIGCQTPYLDPNFSAQLQAHQERERLWAQVAMERARAERERYLAIQIIGERGDSMAKQTALMALAFVNGGGAAHLEGNRFAPLPAIPETQEDRALRWTSVILGPAVGLAAGYFGYRMGVHQSDNSARTTIAGYDTISTIGVSGLNALGSTAQAGFNANQGIANAGYGFGTGVVNTLGRPNFTVTNSGVIGSGSYTGPNSGPNSGNTGRIGSPNCPSASGPGGTTAIGPTGEPLPGSPGGSASINCPGGG